MKKAIILMSCLVMCAGILSCGGGKNIKDSNDFAIDEQGKKASNKGRATGVAAIFDNDKALARDRALNDARNKLVENVLGATISGRSVMKDFELVEMLVQSKSYGLVKNEKIISEKSDDSMYTIELEGIVEQAVVEDAIEDALNRYGKPKFMILINESFEGNMSQPGFTQTELLLQERMGAAGFQFVDIQTVQDLMKRQYGRMASAMKGTVSEDVQNLLLNDVGAEVLIIGTTQTHDQSASIREYSKTMKSKSAIVSLKAIDVYTGRILAVTSTDAPGVHIQSETASKKAVEAVIAKIVASDGSGKVRPGSFMEKLVREFVKAATNRQINVFISGLDYDGLKKFRNEVENRVRGVKQVIEKGRVGKAARVEIHFAGTTSELVDELKAKASKLGFEFEIPDTFPNKITIEAKVAGSK